MNSEAISQGIWSETAYAEMLLRQHPWMRALLHAEEKPLGFSYRNAEVMHGGFAALLGAFCVVDAVLQFQGFPAALAVLVILIGIALLWAGVWLLCFRKRSYIIVTNERVLWRKINAFGKDGKLVEISRADIQRVRYLKSTVMYRIRRKDGAVALYLKNGKTVVISGVRDGETIFTSIR